MEILTDPAQIHGLILTLLGCRTGEFSRTLSTGTLTRRVTPLPFKDSNRGAARHRRASLVLPAFGGLVGHTGSSFVKSATITLYVLRGLRNRKRYVGITKDLTRRLAEHRLNTSKGSQVIGESELILTEEYPSYLTARAREKFLKSGQGRQWLNLTLGK